MSYAITQKPFAESCEQNRKPILQVLQPLLSDVSSVLEIASGTGQHAVYFADALPHLTWQPTDLAEYLPGINLWIEESGLANLSKALRLDVNEEIWLKSTYDVVFTANSLHIISWDSVCAMFRGVGKTLNCGGKFIVYGPFNYQNRYTSESNQRFDGWLKSRDPWSGIRNFEDLNKLAIKHDLQLANDFEMPANNRILYWIKKN